MKFSMIFEAQMAYPTPEHEREVIHNCLEQAVYGEEMGFDTIWAVEHHSLLRYAHMSAPEIFLTAVAARTKRVRIGHGVVCMPFNYNFPVRVCERAAMLDIISNGRVNLGAGRGGTLQEQSACNVDPDRTYEEVEEALRIIGQAWQKETFEWRGKLLTIKAPEGNPPLTIIPRPVQWPHPPLFLACTKPETVVKAAEYGVGALVMGFAGPDSVAEQRRMYDEAAARSGTTHNVSTVQNHYMAALCPTIVGEDREQARQIGARGQRFFGEAIKQWSAGGAPPSEDTEHDDNFAFMERKKQEMLDRYDRGEVPAQFHNQRSLFAAAFNVDHAYGDYRDAIAYVERLEAAGADEIMCFIQLGTVPHPVCMETIRIWGEKIIPHFRAKAGKAERPHAVVA